MITDPVHHTSVLAPNYTITVEYERTADWDRRWVLASNLDYHRTVLDRYASFTEARAACARHVIACRAIIFDNIKEYA